MRSPPPPSLFPARSALAACKIHDSGVVLEAPRRFASPLWPRRCAAGGCAAAWQHGSEAGGRLTPRSAPKHPISWPRVRSDLLRSALYNWPAKIEHWPPDLHGSNYI